MNPTLLKWRGYVAQGATRMRDTMRASATQLASIRRSPRAIGYWLRTAYAAQVALLATVLLMPTIIPAGTDRLLEKAYQPVKEKHFFGLVQSDKQHPLLETRQRQVRALLWFGSGALVLVLLMRRLPRALGEMRNRARELEQEGDRLIKSQLSVALNCYQQALAINTDPEHAKLLRAKIASLDEDLRWQQASATTDGSDDDIVGSRYHIESQLGRGAMGVVYAAHDLRLERDVALKRMAEPGGKDYQLAMRFKQEAKALARLNHPHIVQVYDVIADGGFTWIAMELIDGEELADRIRKEGALPTAEVLRLGMQLASAMAYAHDRGVIHRDFKPANVIIDATGNAKIMDFGMARLAHQSGYTVSGTILGSPAYMSPEQGEGKPADARSDIYALGMTLYEMVTGRVPFEGDTMVAVLVQHATTAPPAPEELNPSVPAGLSRLILDMIAKLPGDRPASMSQVAERLAAL